jgi:hypothetical protein
LGGVVDAAGQVAVGIGGSTGFEAPPTHRVSSGLIDGCVEARRSTSEQASN